MSYQSSVSSADPIVDLLWSIGRGIIRFLLLLATAISVGLSLLPLSCLLLAIPAVIPDESVLSESTGRNRSSWRIGRRLFALATSFALLIALLAVSIEIVSHLPLKTESFLSEFARNVLSLFPSWNLANRLPPTLVNQWHYVLLLVYCLDLLLLFAIGRVPLKYNLRNLAVRSRNAVLTGVAFTLVGGILVVLLSFINGLNVMTEATGNAANVIVLADAANDEVVSSLSYGETGNMQTQIALYNPFGNKLAKPIKVKTVQFGTQSKYLVSMETYCVVNMPVPNPGKDAPARRFIQLRAIEDIEVAAMVHDAVLLPGGRWFTSVGSKGGHVECVIGEGLAGTLGADQGKPMLAVGDTFPLMDTEFEVVGIIKSEGSMFSSEVWGLWSALSQRTGRKTYTTHVIRVDEDSGLGAAAFAKHLEANWKSPRVAAKPETQYYADLAKSNKQFFYGILAVAAVMAIGGIFGVMNTMFQAISQRIKDIGVMRILGFKRWQIMVSFMLESLVIALLGGLLGCALGILADGASAKSIVSGAPGSPGGKSVFLKLTVGLDVLACGVLFTFVMGRLGGFLPSLSAMRLKILDTLR